MDTVREEEERLVGRMDFFEISRRDGSRIIRRRSLEAKE